MRTGKELILATKEFTIENRFRSWTETIFTLVLISIVFYTLFLPFHIVPKLLLSIFCGLLYVRMFVIYHDYQHHAILQKSKLAKVIMSIFGVFILAPPTIWKRSHDFHHAHNSKLTITSIGSYPTISKDRYLKLTDAERKIYLINRHPATILLGYFTLFIYWLNIKSLMESPKKHLDSLLSLMFHLIAGSYIIYTFGFVIFILGWFLPFLIAFGTGSYLFYIQHNFPNAQFSDKKEWTYDGAALQSTSYLKVNPILNWLTGNIGFHHVHHLNSRIPFYRLKEAMLKMPELQDTPTVTLSLKDIYNCLRLKVWDQTTGRMISLSEI